MKLICHLTNDKVGTARVALGPGRSCFERFSRVLLGGCFTTYRAQWQQAGKTCFGTLVLSLLDVICCCGRCRCTLPQGLAQQVRARNPEGERVHERGLAN